MNSQLSTYLPLGTKFWKTEINSLYYNYRLISPLKHKSLSFWNPMSNCYFCIWPVECGCEDFRKPIDKPDGYPDPPHNIKCPNCHERVDGIYTEKVTYCAICFIPCPFCKCHKDPPVPTCPVCSYRFMDSFYPECEQCHTSMNPNDLYCSECGTKNPHLDANTQ